MADSAGIPTPACGPMRKDLGKDQTLPLQKPTISNTYCRDVHYRKSAQRKRHRKNYTRKTLAQQENGGACVLMIQSLHLCYRTAARTYLASQSTNSTHNTTVPSAI